MKRTTYSSGLAAMRAARTAPCSPFEFLLRMRSSRRAPRVPATTDTMLVASAARLMLRSR